MGVILIIHFNIFIVVRHNWLKVAINKVVLHRYQIHANFGEFIKKFDVVFYLGKIKRC